VPPLVRVFTEGHKATVRVKEDAQVMYEMNDIELMREHRQALLREGEGDRLVRRLKGARQKRVGFYAGRMRRRVALLLSTIGLAILLAASAAYALDIQCPPSIGGAICIGTDDADAMVGTDGLDTIVGLGAADWLTGDGNAATVPGDDQLFGGDGSDHLFGGAGSDLLSGEEGADEITASFSVGEGIDTIEGGPGNDTVRAVEGQSDVIDCGPGRDSVEFDVGLDSVKRCEIKNAL
jgi:hypothetical protein